MSCPSHGTHGLHHLPSHLSFTIQPLKKPPFAGILPNTMPFLLSLLLPVAIRWRLYACTHTAACHTRPRLRTPHHCGFLCTMGLGHIRQNSRLRRGLPGGHWVSRAAWH